MSRGMTRQRDELHAVDDWLGATKRVPLTGLDVRRCDGLRRQEERLRILRRLSSDFRRQPKVPFGLGDVNIGIGKDPLSVLRREAGKRVFPNADVYVAKAESDFWPWRRKHRHW